MSLFLPQVVRGDTAECPRDPFLPIVKEGIDRFLEIRINLYPIYGAVDQDLIGHRRIAGRYSPSQGVGTARQSKTDTPVYNFTVNNELTPQAEYSALITSAFQQGRDGVAELGQPLDDQSVLQFRVGSLDFYYAEKFHNIF